MARMRENMIMVATVVAMVGYVTMASTLDSVNAAAGPGPLRIISPTENARTVGVIEVTGRGADPKGEIEVAVFTDRWYVQKGEATINTDGSFSYSPCYLSGQGEFNNHTIRVTVIKDGRRGASAQVTGVVRRGN